MHGFVIDHYRILNEVGAGGTSRVYRALDTKENREVAIKCLDEEKIDDNSARLLFQEEFRRLSQVHHPNFPAAFDIGGLDDRPFFTMELVTGTHLDQIKETELPEFYSILAQLLQALSFLHGRGNVHRDLKSENLILATDGILKVMDFGLLTPIGTMELRELRGTLSCIAPEVIRCGMVTEATDIYSLGVLCYEQLTGRRPFSGSDTDILRSHLFEAPRPLAEIRPDFPKPLIQMIHRMLAKEPTERYQTVLDVAKDLSRLAGKEILIETGLQKVGYLATAHMVGRKEEWIQIHHAIYSLKEAKGGSIFLNAAAGIGKSRLLREARLEAKLAGFKVFSVEASQQVGDPLSVFANLIESTLSGLLYGEIEQRFLHGLSTLVSVPSQANENIPTPSPEKMAETIGSWLGHLAKKQPLVLIFDDLHWSDLLTLDLLNRVIRRLRGSSVLFLGAYRGDELGPGHPILHTVEEGLTKLITLRQFEPEQVRELLEAMLSSHNIPADFVEGVYQASGGNSYLIQELLRYLMDEDFVTRTGCCFSLPHSLEEAATQSGLRHTIERRLKYLHSDARHLIEVAAVLGDAFQISLWFSVSDCSPNRFLEAVQLLQERHFVQRNGDRFYFLHARARSVILDAMSPESSRILHQRAGEKLEKDIKTPRQQLVPILASYFSRGTDSERGINYSLEAGEIALQKGAQAEAFNHFKRAEQLLAVLPDSENQNDRLLTIYERAAQLSSAQWNDAPTCLEWFRKAVDRYQCKGETEKVFSLSLSHAIALTIAGRYREARAVFGRLAESVESDSFSWAVIHGAGVCLIDWYEGYYLSCLENAERSIRVFESLLSDQSPDSNFHPYSWSLFWREKARSYMGKPIDLANIEKIKKLAEIGRSDATIVWHTMTAVGARATFTGRMKELLEWKSWAEESSRQIGKIYWFECWISHSYVYGMLGASKLDALGEHITRLFNSTDPYQKRLGRLFKGRLALAYGNLGAASQSLEAFLKEEELEDPDNSYLEGFIYLAICRIQQGDVESAMALANRGLTFATSGKRSSPLAEVQFREIFAKVAMIRGQAAVAGDELHRALALSQDGDNPIRLGWTYGALGQVAWRESNRLQAADYFHKARECFRQIESDGALLGLAAMENELRENEDGVAKTHGVKEDGAEAAHSQRAHRSSQDVTTT